MCANSIPYTQCHSDVRHDLYLFVICETDVLIFNTVWIQLASCKMSNKFL